MALILFCCCCSIKSFNDKTYDKLNDGDIVDFAVIGNKYFYISEHGLAEFDDKQKIINKISFNDKFHFTSICTSDNRIYAYDYADGYIYTYDPNLKNIGKYGGLSAGMEVIKMRSDKNQIYVLNSYGNKNIIRISLKNNKADKINISQIEDFCIHSSNELYVLQHSTVNNRIINFNTATKDIKIIKDRIITDNIESYNNEIRYVSHDGNVIMVMNSSGKSLKRIPTNYSADFNRINSDKNYIYLISGNNIYGISLNKKDHTTGNKLVLYGISDDDFDLREVLKIMKDKYPDFRYDIKVMDKDMQKYITKILSHDNSYDVYFINDNYLTTPNSNIIEKLNYINENLSKYSNIMKFANQMYPQYIKLCSPNGILLGLPCQVEINGFNVDMKVARKYDIKLPEKEWNWNDYYNLAKEFKDKQSDSKNPAYLSYLSNGNVFCTCLDSWGSGFINFNKKTCSFNSKEYVDLLKFVKKLKDENLVKKEDNGMSADNQLLNMGPLTFFKSDGEKNDDCFLNYPVNKNGKYRDLQVTFICMNKYSKNKELASDFIATWISPDVVSKSIQKIYKDDKIYMNNKDPIGHFYNDKDNESIHQYILDHMSIIDYPDKIRIIVIDNYLDFINGKITAEQASKKTYDGVNKILKE